MKILFEEWPGVRRSAGSRVLGVDSRKKKNGKKEQNKRDTTERQTRTKREGEQKMSVTLKTAKGER